jgi:hypothetical protein
MSELIRSGALTTKEKAQIIEYSNADNDDEKQILNGLLRVLSVRINLIESGVKFPFANSKDDTATHNKYRITLTRSDKKRAPCVFMFYGSTFDYQQGKNTITPYDVLACLGSDYSTPTEFKQFCAEFGYDEDSRRAYKMFLACRKQSERLQKFFNEIEAQLLPY